MTSTFYRSMSSQSCPQDAAAALARARCTWASECSQTSLRGGDGSVTTTIWTDNNFSKKSKCEYSARHYSPPLHGSAAWNGF